MSTKSTAGVSLRHVLVVGGTLAEWAELPDDQWAVRLAELGKVADHAGANWLTLRPFGPGDGPSPEVLERQVAMGACLAVAQPDEDGRARLTRAVAAL